MSGLSDFDRELREWSAENVIGEVNAEDTLDAVKRYTGEMIENVMRRLGYGDADVEEMRESLSAEFDGKVINTTYRVPSDVQECLDALKGQGV